MELERTIKHESKINEVFSFQVFSTKTNIYTLSYLTFACPVFIAFGASSGAMNPPAQETPGAPVTSWQGSAARPGLLGGIGQEGRLPYKTRYLSSSKRIRFCPVSGFWWSLRVDILWRWFRMAMIHVGIIIRIVGHNIHHTSKWIVPHESTWIHMWWCFSHLLAPMLCLSIRKTSPFSSGCHHASPFAS